ncbi:hypothetical protein BSKO_11740 [Bryopsis sp. KO-2023]|nr:hypothetical protein BSKO_11740 [Bryopsis sp. KO-2023]
MMRRRVLSLVIICFIGHLAKNSALHFDEHFRCLESLLHTDKPGPFNVLTEPSDGPFSVHAALFRNASRKVGDFAPESITILKNGTLCFRFERNDGAPGKSGGGNGEGPDLGTGGVKEAVEGFGRRIMQSPQAVGNPELGLMDENDMHVSRASSNKFPFTAIGMLENGCTGSLIGRCHVLTAGHCVLNPNEFQLSKKLKFTPAQNGPISEAPFGTFDFKDVKVARRWAIFSDPANDVAVIHLEGISRLVDETLGYLSVGDGGRSEQLINFNLAGYPEDKGKGEMWFDFCKKTTVDYERRRFANHSCRVERGNSGSPLWVYNSDSDERETRALHVAELSFGRRLDSNTVEIHNVAPQAVLLSGELLEEIKDLMEEMPCE